MKKLLFSLALGIALTGMAAPNLFRNPDFEEVLPSGQAKDWVSKDLAVPGGIGGNALQVRCFLEMKNDPQSMRSYLRQDFKKLAPGEYQISGYINGKDIKALWVGTTSPVKEVGKMHWINAKNLEDDGLKDDWRRFEFVLELKQEADISFVLEVIGTPDSCSLLDNLSMTKIEFPPDKP